MDSGTTTAIAVVWTAGVLMMLAVFRSCKCLVASRATGADTDAYEWLSNSRIRRMSGDKFLSEIGTNKKPFRFKRAQIAGFTWHYSAQLSAGAGGSFSKVFKGALPNGFAVAVRVFNRDLNIDEAQFMAAASTMWRTRHANLVNLIGFCFDDAARALVYEYVDHGALDAFLLRNDPAPAALLEIAVGVAKGMRHLHEECKEKVVHHDIKPSNVLLDGALLRPKLAGVGLAQLLNVDTHVLLSSSLPPAAAAPGYVAPEVRVQQDITEKRDVYSFGMLLLEIVVARNRISGDDDDAAPEKQWFPEVAWIKYATGGLTDLVVLPSRDHTVVAIDDDMGKWTELVERMCKVAFWCVQQQPAARPSMGEVVKMLEGEMDIAPPANPFQDDVLTAPAVTCLRTKVTSTGNTVVSSSRNPNMENVASGAAQVIDSVVKIIETVSKTN